MGRSLGKPLGPELGRMLSAYNVQDLTGLADRLKLPASTVRNWHTRDNVPQEWLMRAANDTGVTIDWLLKGGERKPGSTFFPSTPLLVKKSATPDAFAGQKQEPFHVDLDEASVAPFAVPLFDIAASAGDGNGHQEPTDVVQVYFSPEYMRRHFGRAGNGFAMIYVKGDSMASTLLDGEEIVVDTRVRRVDRDGIYVLSLRGDLKVKRIQIRLDGSLLVKSDNPAYDPETVGAKDADQFQVEGRLVWPRLR